MWRPEVDVGNPTSSLFTELRFSVKPSDHLYGCSWQPACSREPLSLPVEDRITNVQPCSPRIDVGSGDQTLVITLVR